LESDWIKIYSTAQQYKIEIVKAVLLENEIDAFEINKRDSMYQSFGEYELYVKPENVMQSKSVLQNLSL
jgi:hypothetical protein